jgi:hypothetical protein
MINETDDFVYLHEIVESRRPLVIELTLGDRKKSIEIFYNPSVLTPQFESEVMKFNEESDTLSEPVMKMIFPLIVDWNIRFPNPEDPAFLPENLALDPEDSKRKLPDPKKYPPVNWPPTEENLRQLPIEHLLYFVQSIIRDAAPKKAKSGS